MRYAVVQDGVVVNVVMWDGVSEWAPPAACTVVQSDTASIGDAYDGEKFAPASGS